MKRILLATAAAMALSVFTAHAQSNKPNILVIMTDDVGIWNISGYHREGRGPQRAAP
jgi:hypothetical protein